MSGFREVRSGIDNVIAFASDIHLQKSAKNITAGVFLDIKAAFEIVDHEAIRREMTLVGLRGGMRTWLFGYLQNHHVYMTTYEIDTKRHDITQGVPQGGVLVLSCLKSVSSASLKCYIRLSTYLYMLMAFGLGF